MTTFQPGQTAQMPAGLAIITRVEREATGWRIFFRYLRKGKASKTERNVWESG